MFIGHYSAAFAARALKPAIPLWALFVAVQLIDFAFMAFIMMNLEQVRIVPGFTEASALDLYYMPFTHSLVAVIVWSLAAGVLYAALRNGGNKLMAGLIIGAAVLSHWLLDLIVHVPDLPIVFGEPKLGFGLWRSMLWSQLVEFGFLLIGFAIYLLNTRPKGRAGQVAPWVLLVFMVGLQVYNLTAPANPDASMIEMGAIGLAAFTVLALAAGIAGHWRRPAWDDSPARDTAS